MTQATVHWLDVIEAQNDEGIVKMRRKIEAENAKFDDSGVLHISTTDSPLFDTVIPSERVIKLVYQESEV